MEIIEELVSYTGRWFLITCVPRAKGRKTDVYHVWTTEGGALGEIRWYAPWRCYSFFPVPLSVFEAQCMTEISTFLLKCTMQHRAQKPVQAQG